MLLIYINEQRDLPIKVMQQTILPTTGLFQNDLVTSASKHNKIPLRLDAAECSKLQLPI